MKILKGIQKPTQESLGTVDAVRPWNTVWWDDVIAIKEEVGKAPPKSNTLE